MRHPFFAAVLGSLVIGSAQVALADGIELSGSVAMGLSGGSQPGPQADARTTLLSDLDLQIRMSRTTDSGLTLAFEIDLDGLDERLRGSGPHDRSVPFGN